MLWAVFIGLYAWAFLATVWAGLSVRGFLSRYQSISDEAAIEAFKSLARWNMYLALVQLVVLVGGTLVGVVLVSRDGLWPGLGAVLLANGMLLGLGKLLKGQEDRTRALPAATEELAAAHARVSDTWLHKATPDF